jgi:hypothetical protein
MDPPKRKLVSRQRLWQKKRIAQGRCALFGERRPPDLKTLCRICQDKANELHLRMYYKRKAS